MDLPVVSSTTPSTSPSIIFEMTPSANILTNNTDKNENNVSSDSTKENNESENAQRERNLPFKVARFGRDSTAFATFVVGLIYF